MQSSLADIHIILTSQANLKISRGMEVSHLVYHEGHVRGTLLLFREIVAGKAAAAKVSSAGMTPACPTSKPRQKGY